MKGVGDTQTTGELAHSYWLVENTSCSLGVPSPHPHFLKKRFKNE